MFIDYLVVLIAKYGYILVLLFGLGRFILLQWFKPGNLAFSVKNFFLLGAKVKRSTREMENPKWSFFTQAYNVSSYLFYGILFLWFFLFIILHAANPSLFSQ